MSERVTALSEVPAPRNGSDTIDRGEPSATQRELAHIIVDSLRVNNRLNYLVRSGLALFAISCSVLALIYAGLNAGPIVAAGRGDGAVANALLATTLPVLLLVGLAALAGVACWAVHSRGVDEMYGTLDTVSRMEREGEVAVSSRGLIYAFEEKLQNTRRAFTLLLWLGRTLFIVCLGVCVAAVINAIAKGSPLLTGALGGGSVLGAVLGVATKIPRNIAHNLADVIQIQTAVTGCDRQISLLETAAIDAVNHCDDRQTAHERVLDVQQRMDQVVANAVWRIERFADPEYSEGARDD